VTDVGDAAWLAELLEHGLLRASFVPPPAIRELRDLTRYRRRLIQAHSGERDPGVLAELAKGRLRAKLPQLRQALGGRFREHHALLIRLAVAHLEQLEASIAELDTHIDRVLAPFAAARDRLDTSPGWASGPPRHARRDRPRHGGVPHRHVDLASWAGRCPGNNRTGGKRRSGRPTKGNRWLGEVLTWVRLGGGPQPRHLPVGPVLAAGPPHRQEEGRGRRQHSILVIAWHLLTDSCDHQDLGGDDFIRRDTDRQRQRAVTQLQALGYRVVLEPWPPNTPGIHVSG
jgi:hypothetical protein